MRKLLNGYYKFLKILLAALMGLLVIPVMLQIVARYLGFIPRYIWTEEMARFCFIWVILFTVDLLPKAKTPRGEALAKMFVDFWILMTALIFIIWGWPLVQFGLLQTSEMAELPMVLIYMAWPIAGITWILFLIEKFVDNIKLWRSDTQ